MQDHKVKAFKNPAMVAIKILIVFFSLYFIGYSRAQDTDVNLLIERLNDKDWVVRYQSAEALGKIKDARTVEPLIATLKKDVYYYVRKTAAWALGEIKDPRAVKPLLVALRGEESEVIRTAKEALQKIVTSSVEPFIVALRDKDKYVRMEAAEILAEIKNERVVEVLVAAMKDKDLEIVAGAHLVFIRLGNPGTEAILVEALNGHGNSMMALNFINCGNSQLAAAGLKWAESRGYKIQYLYLPQSISGSSSRWGSNR